MHNYCNVHNIVLLGAATVKNIVNPAYSLTNCFYFTKVNYASVTQTILQPTSPIIL